MSEGFQEYNLDSRILASISKIGWSQPTNIQNSVIPLILQSKNVIIQGRTGSGKTGAYAIPLIHRLIIEKDTQRYQKSSMIILTPTKELCQQTLNVIQSLTAYCDNSIKSMNIAVYNDENQLKTLLSEKPDVIISTPSRLLKAYQSNCLSMKEIEKMVIDESDLMATFGYLKDIQALANGIPKNVQYVLLSATSDESVRDLRKLFVKNTEWTKVELEEDSYLPDATQLSQYFVRAEEDDKFVILVTMLKLRLVKGKTIVFSNSIDRCYKIRLFLEEFGIRSALLNSELPASCRIHAIEQFNQGFHDYLICTDDGNEQTSKTEKVEYGVSRGIDFQLVSNIINFDFPLNPKTYIHRVGRTARADQYGTSISFVSHSDDEVLAKTENFLKKTPESGDIFRQYLFNKEEVDGFRYRALDVKKKITRKMIRDVRLKEIKLEILNSEQLKAYFNSHIDDYNSLRHDKIINKTSYGHLKDIPDYLIPASLRKVLKIKSGASNSSSRGAFRRRKHEQQTKTKEMQKMAKEGVKSAKNHDRITKPIVLAKESAASQFDPRSIKNTKFVKKVRKAKHRANNPMEKISRGGNKKQI